MLTMPNLKRAPAVHRDSLRTAREGGTTNPSATTTTPASAGKRFGPDATDVRVTPRRGEPESDIKLQKPHTGMTIRLTPELIAVLQKAGPKPAIELVLKSVAEGGPVLTVGGVRYNTNAHKMAVGSEVHIVARTEPAQSAAKVSGAVGGKGMGDAGDNAAAPPGMSIFASLHRKLIVQQVLTQAKRTEIRARKDEIDRLEKEAKNKMKRMDDDDEMLAAAVSIPVPSRQGPAAAAAAAAAGSSGGRRELHESGGGGAGAQRNDRKRPRTPPGVGEDGGGDGDGDGGNGQKRDPLTAWVYDCYRSDDYCGHVSDVRHFLKGIDFRHVMFRYHVNPDGTLAPDRRRFCIRFKTKGGRDLAVGRSGEALGASGSWGPNSVAVVKGRNEDASRGGEGLSDFLMVLPQGRSVAEVLNEVKARLPDDLTPALQDENSAAIAARAGRGKAGRGSQGHQPQHRHHQTREDQHRLENHRQTLESYRRDMLRAALGATLAEAGSSGPEWGAPEACVAGTDEENARRVATVAANEACRELDVGAEAAGGRGRKGGDGSRGGSVRRVHLPSGPAGGARAQRRAAAERQEWQPVQ